MQKEFKAVSTLLKEPRRPAIYVLGGAKVEDNVPVIDHILERDKADKILLREYPSSFSSTPTNTEHRQARKTE